MMDGFELIVPKELFRLDFASPLEFVATILVEMKHTQVSAGRSGNHSFANAIDAKNEPKTTVELRLVCREDVYCGVQ
jgi:hypothetical protein